MQQTKEDSISLDEILEKSTAKWVGRHFCYEEETDSTNLAAKRLAAQGALHGTTVLADKQTAGRGRRGRNWQSPAGYAVYMSLLLKPDFAPDKASMLTLVMALSVAEAVQKVTELTPAIKWPNDIVIDGRKICGILTEMEMTEGKISHVIIGVGINVNNPAADFAKEIQHMAGSLMLAAGRKISRNTIIAEVLSAFEKNYECFLQTMDLSSLRKSYEAYLINYHAKVKVLEPQGEYTGTAEGINDTGELLVEKEDGETVCVYAGEVSVRGLYGYV